MKPSQLEKIVRGIGAALLLSAVILLIGHWISANLAFPLLMASFSLSLLGQIFTNKRFQQLQVRNQELEARLADHDAVR